MPQILCMTSLVISALVLLLFSLDLASGFPFGGTKVGGLLGHLGIIFGAVVVGAFSLMTILENKK